MAASGDTVTKRFGRSFIVVFVALLIAFVSFIPFFFGVCYTSRGGRSAWARVIWGIVQIYIMFSVYYNYFAAVFTVSQAPRTPQQYSDAGIAALNEDPFCPLGPFTCRTCNKARIPRSHHCSVVGNCVIRYDHYCPWVGLIGADNYPYFFLFLVHGFLGSLLSALNSVLFLALAKHSIVDIELMAEDLTRGAVVGVVLVLVSAFMGAIWAICLFGMLRFHIGLLCKNRTTTDTYDFQDASKWAKEHHLQWANPYDLGVRGNVRQVFGERWNFWLIFLLSAGFKPDPMTGDAAAVCPVNSSLPPVLPHVPPQMAGNKVYREQINKQVRDVLSSPRNTHIQTETRKRGFFQVLFGEKPVQQRPNTFLVPAYISGTRFSGVYIGTYYQLCDAGLITTS